MGDTENGAALGEREQTLAQVLLKAGQITQAQVDAFLSYRWQRENNGKPYLGKILIDLGMISQGDIDAYIAKNKELHANLLVQLVREGYLTKEQEEQILAKEKETGSDLISLISDLNIMTRENYVKIFNKRAHVLRLGEWLVMERKRISQEQLQQAVKLQGVTEFDDYLVQYCNTNPDLIKKVREKIASHFAG